MVVFKKINGGIHSPGTIFSFFWFIFTLVPIVFVFSVPIHPLPILFILLTCVLFNLTSVPFNLKQQNRLNSDYKLTFIKSLDTVLIKYIFIISTFCGLYFSIFQVFQNGFSAEQFLLDFIVTSSKYASERTKDSHEYGLIGILSVFFTYISVVLGALYYHSNVNRNKIILFFALSPSIVTMLVQCYKYKKYYNLCIFLFSISICCFYVS